MLPCLMLQCRLLGGGIATSFCGAAGWPICGGCSWTSTGAIRGATSPAAAWPCSDNPPKNGANALTGGFAICIFATCPFPNGWMPVPCHIPACPDVRVRIQVPSIPIGGLSWNVVADGGSGAVCSVLHCDAAFCSMALRKAAVSIVPQCKSGVSTVAVQGGSLM